MNIKINVFIPDRLSPELTKKYKWNILELCETRWKDNGNLITDDGHMFFYSGETKYHRNGVGFMIHEDIKDTVMECTPISSRMCTIRIKTKPLNITIVQIYVPTSVDMHVVRTNRKLLFTTPKYN